MAGAPSCSEVFRDGGFPLIQPGMLSARISASQTLVSAPSVFCFGWRCCMDERTSVNFSLEVKQLCADSITEVYAKAQSSTSIAVSACSEALPVARPRRRPPRKRRCRQAIGHCIC